MNRSDSPKNVRCLTAHLPTVLGIAILGIVCLGADSPPQKPATQSAAEKPDRRVLHIYADPNNLPFTNDRLEGFENKIAEIIAREMGARVEYTWYAQRRGFFRHSLKEGDADLVLGVPVESERALVSNPYYRSIYVFVYRKDKGLKIQSFDDPILHDLKIGVQLVGDDNVNTPPAHALARRNIIDNVTGYTVYGDYREGNPPAKIIEAVAKGEIDVAVVWGPLGGYFASRQSVPLEVVPVSQQLDPPALSLAFDIGMGVKKKDTALRDRINAILAARRPEIEKVLDSYGVPRVPADDSPHSSPRSDEVTKKP